MKGPELSAFSAANLEAAFERAVESVGDRRGASRRFGDVLAAATGLTAAFYNPALALRASVDPHDVGGAVEWLRARGVAPSVWTRVGHEAALAGMLASVGLVTDGDRSPTMALHPVPPPPAIPPPPPELTIRVVDDATSLEDWHASAISGPSIRRYTTLEFARHPDNRLVVGYVEGVPVTGAAVYGGGGAVGVFAVGTIEAARRRGYGTAITWAAIEAGRVALGVDVAVLQATEMGEPIYRSMGFVEVDRYAIYAAPG